MNPAHIDPQRFGSKPAEAGGLPQVSLHTVLIAARCWWHIALPMGVLLASAAAVVVYYISTPTYTAQTWVIIKARPPVIIRDVSADEPQKFVQNQKELIKSPLVLDDVAADPKVANTPELVKEPDDVQYLRTHVRVNNQGGSDYFTIEFTSQSPEKAAYITNRVAFEYRSWQEANEEQLYSLTIAALQVQHKNKEDEVETLRKQLEEFVRNDPTLALPGTQKRNEPRAGFNEREHTQSQIAALEIEQIELSAKIAALKRLLTRMTFDPTEAEIEAIVQSRPQVQLIKAQIDQDEAKAAEHKEKSPDPAKNNLLQQLLKRIEGNKAALEKELVAVRQLVKEDLKKGNVGHWQDQLAQLEHRYQVADDMKSHLVERLKKLGGEEQKQADNAQTYQFTRDDYERKCQLRDAIAMRIESMNMERGAPARIDIAKMAEPPTRPDEMVPYKKMGMAACAALLAPFALAVGIEVLFRRVSSRQQLEAAGQIAVVGEVTNLPTRIRSRRAASDLDCRDRQLFEESIDGLRTYLSLVDSMRGRKILAVTSAISREGKTSLASQLAVSIASATGRPTLLIDGDLRSPDVHHIFDVDRGPGLCDVLLGKCSVEEAIETGFSDTLHLLTAGELEASPHRVLSNNAFNELMAKLSGMYDQIVIDTPPILAASEALLMASAADAAVLCVRRDFSRMDQVSEAFARLRSTGVQTAGAVLNGIPARHYAYRYGSYYYNRQRQPSAPAEGSEAESA